MQAEIILEYANARVAEAIAKAVSPDNFKTPKGLSIKTTRETKRVITTVKWNGKLPALIGTIDDLLFCISTAEKTVQTANKLE